MPPSPLPEPDARALSLFRAARWIGALLLLVAIVMLMVFPKTAGTLPPGFRTPILAFELAESRAEVEALFGEPASPLREEIVTRMDRGNAFDYAFLVLYATLLAVVAIALARMHGARFLPAAVIAPLAAAADAVENLQMFAITRALGGDYAVALERLALWTRLKWGGLALALVWLAPALLRGGRLERAVAALCVATAALAAGTELDRASFAESFALCMSLAFVGLWIAALRQATGRRPE